MLVLMLLDYTWPRMVHEMVRRGQALRGVGVMLEAKASQQRWRRNNKSKKEYEKRATISNDLGRECSEAKDGWGCCCRRSARVRRRGDATAAICEGQGLERDVTVGL